MPAIRALPWTSNAELAQLYAWIWDDPDDTQTTDRAIARLATYMQAPSQPLFIPLLHSLLTALRPRPPHDAATHLSARLALGAAVTRFVNSLVDPLQTRSYARPIAGIARELGMPEGLVGVRHAVTHEDLPGLGVLRCAAERGVEWLRREVVGPALAAEGVVATEAGWAGEEEFGKVVGRYKRLVKMYYRSRTGGKAVVEAGGWEGARELRLVLREVEDLVAEGGERVARAVVRVLLGRQGGMVPSIKKRPRFDPERPDVVPPPTTAILRIWTPLLTLLNDKFSTHDGTWPETFASECAALLLETLAVTGEADEPLGKAKAKASDPAEEQGDYWLLPSDEDAPARPEAEERTSYITTLTSWLLYALSPAVQAEGGRKRKRAEGEGVLVMDEEARGRVVRAFVAGGGDVRVMRNAKAVYDGRVEGATPRLSHVLAAVMHVDAGCREAVYALAAGGEGVADDSEDVLERRLALFRKMMSARAGGEVQQAGVPGVDVRGWMRLGEGSGWKECPIGYWRG